MSRRRSTSITINKKGIINVYWLCHWINLMPTPSPKSTYFASYQPVAYVVTKVVGLCHYIKMMPTPSSMSTKCVIGSNWCLRRHQDLLSVLLKKADAYDCTDVKRLRHHTKLMPTPSPISTDCVIVINEMPTPSPMLNDCVIIPKWCLRRH